MVFTSESLKIQAVPVRISSWNFGNIFRKYQFLIIETPEPNTKGSIYPNIYRPLGQVFYIHTPLISGERGTKICNYKQHHSCLELARKTMFDEFKIKMSCDPVSVDSQVICNCLPRCNDITYDFDKEKTHLNRKSSYLRYFHVSII